MGEKSTIEIP